jgi:Cap4 SAVED domain
MSNIKFTPSVKNFVILFKHLQTYIDDFNQIKEITEIEDMLISILKEEQILEDKDGKKLVRLDKIGKMGEYLFCCLLSDFFNFDCILPKVHLQTDPNMNVYGIDTLFYSENDNLILFGESKLSLRLDNGLNLIKASLKDYEKQVSDEFNIVLSNRLYKDRLYKFNEIYGDVAEISISMRDFIKKANITKIGIPIFIAHGTETEPEEILFRLEKLKKEKLFNLETKYYSISLPIVNKNKLVATFTKKIREKEDYYRNEVTK